MSGGWDVPQDDARVESCHHVPCLQRMAVGDYDDEDGAHGQYYCFVDYFRARREEGGG